MLSSSRYRLDLWRFTAWTTQLLILLLLDKGYRHGVYAKPGLCEVETGQGNIVLDIEESRGSQINQMIRPSQLPIMGDPFNEITMDLVFPSRNPLFTLIGKRLQLIQSLDRDAENLSHIVFQVTCVIRSSGKKRTIPVIVRTTDINDNAPMFLGAPYQVTVPELTSVGSSVASVKTKDADTGVNALVEYLVVPGNVPEEELQKGRVGDGAKYFKMKSSNSGEVILQKGLDFEKIQKYFVTIQAMDRAKHSEDRLTSTTTLTVSVKDEDDQDPSFIYQGCTLQDGACVNPEYHTTISSGVNSGVLTIRPEKIQAVDGDSLNYPVKFSFVNGIPSFYSEYFTIDSQFGTVKQIKPVESALAKQFVITVKAEEESPNRRATTAKLYIDVKPIDINPPIIHSSASGDGYGFVEENSPIGTKVVDKNGNPIQFTVTDDDLNSNDPKITYSFELTTNSFNINNDGYLFVNEDKLDRDPPNPGKYRFQIVAREINGHAGSIPYSITVFLKDVNDNFPRIPMISPITIQAGNLKRQLVQIKAMDIDEGQNSNITYSLYHVSNQGFNKFYIDPVTGWIESTGRMMAGDQYSITVQATDSGGLYGQGIVEVIVIAGPNTKPPAFSQSSYEVTISEGSPINTTVIELKAIDPENDPVFYSILSGNDLRQFAIGEKTGIISVIRKLDREELTRYQLLIKAQDEGGLSSTTTLNIKVSDINDKNPEFIGLPYEFSVEEGVDGAPVGKVEAVDGDEGINSVIHYSIPDDLPFLIDANSGHIRTAMALNYEMTNEYKFVVTAQDGAPDPRIGTASVTVLVKDTEDEIPTFRKTVYESKVPENTPDFIVTQVQADDPDTTKKVTYIIKQGPSDLFTIDPITGIIKTLRGLDYEKDSQHTLIVGTLENLNQSPGATTKVIVNVEDRNDISPVFLTIPSPITLDDDVPIGTKVTTLIATDADGTSPGNKVRYELNGQGKALKYFHIDPDLGVVYVHGDLQKEPDNEYQIDVKAYDLGEPQLSSITSVTVFIRRVTTPTPELGMGFSDDSYSARVLESAAAGTLVKILTVVHPRPSHPLPLICTIISGNSEGVFSINVTTEKNCEVRLKDSKLDHEHADNYQLKIRLDTLDGVVNPAKSITILNVQVIDINDNSPIFIYPDSSKHFAKNAYYGAISADKEVGSTVLRVKAEDLDGGTLGDIRYELVEDEDQNTTDGPYFSVDPETGIIKTLRTLIDVPTQSLPFRLVVTARDNPEATNPSDFNTAQAHVVINVIKDEHRIVMAIDGARPDVVKASESKLIDVLENSLKLIVGGEKVLAKQYRRRENLTVETDPSSSDFWFYIIDPTTETILERNNTRVARGILNKSSMGNITSTIVEKLHIVATDIHPPLQQQQVSSRPQIAGIAIQWIVFPYTLILIAALILILGIAGIIYICISWSRYKSYKERMARMYATQNYDPIFVEPNMKEYEVLQMSVPIDDNDSYNDLQLDFSRKNHTFTMENVGYITKENVDSIDGHSPVSSEAATTARTSSMGRNRANGSGTSTFGRINQAFDSDGIGDTTAVSSTNGNVTFREKKEFGRPLHNGNGMTTFNRKNVEVTTEL
ncbi:cadherin-99C isoform X2 [Daktulosphaira vitifoliae]|uniref:cadherin-99C isoform X2 n=1 Tax=Daktulosphaira vitifoliae TaxID=58002 RepID=UPI0021AAC209|nr:cadherin-99C isoform X2 [Daktulosphaira vitifoliae]